jgi:hypothetical protein
MLQCKTVSQQQKCDYEFFAEWVEARKCRKSNTLERAFALHDFANGIRCSRKLAVSKQGQKMRQAAVAGPPVHEEL